MKEMICIVCPNGCRMEAEESDGRILVRGNRCKRGEEFVRSELTCPMRTVCSTVRTAFSEAPALPVRVSAPIPKDQIFPVMHAIHEVYLTRRVARGEAVIRDVLGLGVAVIATIGILIQEQ